MRLGVIWTAREHRRAALAWTVLGASLAAMLPTPSRADPGQDSAAAPIPLPPGTPAPQPASGSSLPWWLNPATAPFLPVPLIGVDPNSGTTFGLLPVRLQTDADHQISRIYAPDLYYNPYFGYGAHARVYDYPSQDQQWSIVTGASERVERDFDAEYQSGRLREQPWSFNASLIFDRSGTPRFYGIGNDSPQFAQTNYTEQEEVAQVRIGFNLSHAWQLSYTGRVSVVDVLPGTLSGIATLETRFGHIAGVGTNDQLLNRASITYDTRDNLSAPSQGAQWVAYTGLASRRGLLNDSMYSEAGVDGRNFLQLGTQTILATHVALRYLPDYHRLPFWALSSIGGDQSEIGGDQPLRGYGTGRYYDRDYFSSSIELRHTIASINAITSQVDLELAPFLDLGRVFATTSTFPLSQLHPVGGLGIRGIARPNVVGYVDFGYGHEGAAVFTGINYPF